MKETTFIDQNREKWEKFEKLSNKSGSDPDEISKLFVEITDDLSYAKTHYPKRTVRVYLNNLAQSVFLNLHKNSSGQGRFRKFWAWDLPLEMYQARKTLLFCFLSFVLFMTIGMISTDNNPKFLLNFVDQGYLDFTDDAIERGDPAAIYSTGDSTHSFLWIARNNIWVSFLAFTLGMAFSVGTMLFMLYNGIMVGSFWYYFYLKNAFVTASSAIWIHGAFEIPSILLAGTAGLVVGNSLLFPGTYTRGQSLIIGGKRGIRIMMGMIPFLLAAALFEGYVTRHYQTMPGYLNWVIIFTCLAAMVFVFVVYPYLKFHGKKVETMQDDLVLRAGIPVSFWRIRKVSDIFTAAFSVQRRIFGKVGGTIVVLCLLHVLTAGTYLFFAESRFLGFGNWQYQLGLITGISHNPDYLLIALHTVFLSVSGGLITSSVRHLEHGTENKVSEIINASLKFSFVVITVMALALMTLDFPTFVFLFFGIVPVLLIAVYASVREGSVANALQSGFRDYFSGIGVLATFAVLLILLHYALYPFVITLGYSELALPTNLVISNLNDILLIQVRPLMEYPLLVSLIFLAVLYLIIAHILFPVFYIGFALFYYSNKEKEEARGLFDRLKTFGESSKVYESEV